MRAAQWRRSGRSGRTRLLEIEHFLEPFPRLVVNVLELDDEAVSGGERLLRHALDVADGAELRQEGWARPGEEQCAGSWTGVAQAKPWSVQPGRCWNGGRACLPVPFVDAVVELVHL